MVICKLPRYFIVSFESTGLLVQERKIDFQDGSRLGFLIGQILAIFDLQVTLIRPTKFWVTWPFWFRLRQFKIVFQDSHHGSGHLGFLIGTILASSDLQVTMILPTKFCVSWSMGSGDKGQNRFQDGRHGSHLGFPIRMIIAIFYLQAALTFPTKFQVSWPF